MIGLTESADVYSSRGYTPVRSTLGYRSFRKRGMPFSTQPREHLNGTWSACRVVVATRRLHPERELAVFRALQFAQFTSTLDLETPADQREAISWVSGIDPDAVIAAAQEPETEELFAADRAEARTAAGGPTEFQGKAAQYSSDANEVRYTAPSLKIATADGRMLEAGGFQTIEAYDVIIANLDTSLTPAPGGGVGRRDPAGVPRRPEHRRGRRDHDAQQRLARPRRGRGQPDRGRRCRRGRPRPVRPRRAVAARDVPTAENLRGALATATA